MAPPPLRRGCDRRIAYTPAPCVVSVGRTSRFEYTSAKDRIAVTRMTGVELERDAEGMGRDNAMQYHSASNALLLEGRRRIIDPLHVRAREGWHGAPILPLVLPSVTSILRQDAATPPTRPRYQYEHDGAMCAIGALVSGPVAGTNAQHVSTSLRHTGIMAAHGRVRRTFACNIARDHYSRRRRSWAWTQTLDIDLDVDVDVLVGAWDSTGLTGFNGIRTGEHMEPWFVSLVHAFIVRVIRSDPPLFGLPRVRRPPGGASFEVLEPRLRYSWDRSVHEDDVHGLALTSLARPAGLSGMHLPLRLRLLALNSILADPSPACSSTACACIEHLPRVYGWRTQRAETLGDVKRA